MGQSHRRHKHTINRLWVARKRAGYPLKWVASLLGHESISVVSEYERGRVLPNLRTALKLERIYETPLAELFPDFHAELVQEIEEVKERNAMVRKHDEERQQVVSQLAENAYEPEVGGRAPVAIHARICNPPQSLESSRSRQAHGISVSHSSRVKNSSVSA